MRLLKTYIYFPCGSKVIFLLEEKFSQVLKYMQMIVLSERQSGSLTYIGVSICLFYFYCFCLDLIFKSFGCYTNIIYAERSIYMDNKLISVKIVIRNYYS